MAENEVELSDTYNQLVNELDQIRANDAQNQENLNSVCTIHHFDSICIYMIYHYR